MLSMLCLSALLAQILSPVSFCVALTQAKAEPEANSKEEAAAKQNMAAEGKVRRLNPLHALKHCVA